MSKSQVSKIDVIATLVLPVVASSQDFSAESRADISRILSFWADLKREGFMEREGVAKPVGSVDLRASRKCQGSSRRTIESL